MRSCIKNELSRAFKNRAMYTALLIGAVIAMAQILLEVVPVLEYQESDTFTSFPHTSYEHYMGLKNGSMFAIYYYMFMVVLAAVPCAITAYTDYKSGYLKQIFTRSHKKYYYISKYIAAFFSAGTVAVIPQILNFMVVALMLPSIQPYVGIGYVGLLSECMWADIYYQNAFLYVMMYWVLDFVVYGCMNMLSVALMWFFDNKFAVLLLPFFFYQMLNLGMQFVGKAALMPDSFLRPGQPMLGAEFHEILLIIVGIVFICVISCTYGMKKQDYYR
ncbi:MAG: hypothetical protein IKK03_05635 [Lachnospiraceae bacterium]|nr:hypothetical protein [Lachnospiraceae bacterium]